MEDFCFMCMFKDFRTNRFGLHVESSNNVYYCMMDQSKKDEAVGGTLDRKKVESLRDFLNIILEPESKLKGCHPLKNL